MRNGMLVLSLCLAAGAASGQPQQPVRVAASKTHLETADGKPFFFLSDTCWTGPALSTEAEWAEYLADRKAKGFTAVQFNLPSPWRTAPTDNAGRASYTLEGEKLVVNTAFFDQAEARMKAIVDAGLLPVPVLIWANSKVDAGNLLTDEQVITLVNYELDRLQKYPALWILAGDAGYRGENGKRWQRIGAAVFQGREDLLVTIHPNGENYPWNDSGWPEQKWVDVASYQSGHGDSKKTFNWLLKELPKTHTAEMPVINLEPPYEGHNGYASRKPHSALSTRRATYWSLLRTPVAGVSYGGHGVWSWHTRPSEEPTSHKGTGVAKVWREALKLPFTTQLNTLRATFELVDWTKLRPAQELLSEQPGDAEPTRYVAIAAIPSRDAAIVYSPVGASGLALVDAKLLADKKLTLVNPVTGDRVMTTPEKLAADATQATSVDGDVLLVVGGRE